MGANDAGQLGLTHSASASPRPLHTPNGNAVTSVAAGGDMTAFVAGPCAQCACGWLGDLRCTWGRATEGVHVYPTPSPCTSTRYSRGIAPFGIVVRGLEGPVTRCGSGLKISAQLVPGVKPRLRTLSSALP